MFFFRKFFPIFFCVPQISVLCAMLVLVLLLTLAAVIMGNCLTNSNGGVYSPGEKAEVRTVCGILEVYADLHGKMVTGGVTGAVNMTEVAALSGVTPPTATKYCRIYEDEGVSALITYMGRNEKECIEGGPGSKTIDGEGLGVLMKYYEGNPSAPLYMFQNAMMKEGYSLSEATLCRIFKSYGMNRGIPNLIPIDKFSDQNFVNLLEYVDFMSYIHFSRVVAFDEAHFDGSNVWRRKVRRHPVTGLFPDIPVSGNFRVRWNCYSSCQAVTHNDNFPVQCSISTENGDAAGFVEFFKRSAAKGCYAPYSVGILDNATIHVGALGEELADFAWNYLSPMHNFQPLRMLLVPLPTRHFELNPQELVFAFATNKMTSYDISGIVLNGNTVPEFALRAFNDCTHQHVFKFFQHCGYGR